MDHAKKDTSDRELVITRMINAPVHLLWEVWTRPERIAQWWGPDGFANTIHKMDVKPGGEWEFVMHGPDGTDYKNKSVYKEIIPFELIVFDHVSGPKFMTTVEFTDLGDETRIRWQMVFNTAEEFRQAVKTFKADEGLKQNLVKLNAYAANLNRIMKARDLDYYFKFPSGYNL